jgi:hypothetical protein
MTDKELERIISFIVNENVIRRLLSSVDQFEHGRTEAKDKMQKISLVRFFN